MNKEDFKRKILESIHQYECSKPTIDFDLIKEEVDQIIKKIPEKFDYFLKQSYLYEVRLFSYELIEFRIDSSWAYHSRSMLNDYNNFETFVLPILKLELQKLGIPSQIKIDKIIYLSIKYQDLKNWCCYDKLKVMT